MYNLGVIIHTILQCLCPKDTAWNEFSSAMASAIICLATNQKFNFSKFSFEGQNDNVVEKVVDAAQVSTAATTDKGKGIMIEEPVKSMKKKDQISFDEEVALKLQAEFDEEERHAREKATLFQQLLEKRRKHFAAKSEEEKRNKPPTQAQQRKIMCTYLKNMEGKKLKDLKNKYFDFIQKMFDKAFKRVNTFVNFRTDLVEGSLKTAGEELEQESTKK
ncbi:hypothetical protein Tco_0448346 [Tanacetum coccineum]